ncbi:MAG: AAA family ATPase [Tannerella sp.]|jgi:exonuclease SbcC|nr:AAA family ATPase [Tannerella sp.]
MKILAIRGKNLASLEGEFEVDFTVEPLKSAGIFAITGNTGSGKSTLLDAICLALFNETPRINRAADNADIVDVKDLTIKQKDSRTILRRGTADGYAEVDFVSLAGDKYRARWSVRRSRDKVDGSLQNATYKVLNLTSNTELQGGKTELLAKVKELIGLTFDQFTRAVMLAQGDFATFLKAAPKEKAELLEKLTGTDIYSRISSKIYEKTKQAEAELSLINERIKDIELLTDEQLAELTTEKETIEKETNLINTDIKILTDKLTWLQTDEQLTALVTTAQNDLEKSKQVIEEAKPRFDYLARIESVQQVRDRYKQLENDKKLFVSAEASLRGQQALSVSNNESLLKAKVFLATCQETKSLLSAEWQNIEPQVKEARKLDVQIEGITKSHADIEKEVFLTAGQKTKCETSIKTCENNILSIQKSQDEIARWFTANEYYTEIVSKIDLIVSFISDTQSSEKQVSGNENLLKSTSEALEKEVQQLTFQQAEAKRLNDILPAEIAILRAKLVVNEPCPVCGSTHHPISGVIAESLEEKALNDAKATVAIDIERLAGSITNRKEEMIRLQSLIASYKNQRHVSYAKLSEAMQAIPDWNIRYENNTLNNELKTISKKWKENIALQASFAEQLAAQNLALTTFKERLTELTVNLSEKQTKRTTIFAELEQLTNKRKELLNGKKADEVEKIYVERLKTADAQIAKATESQNSLIAKGENISGMITQITDTISRLTNSIVSLETSVTEWLSGREDHLTIEELTSLLSKDTIWLTTERESLDKLKKNELAAYTTLAERQRVAVEHQEANVKPADEETKELLNIAKDEKTQWLNQRRERVTEISVLFTNHEKGKIRIKQFEKELAEKGTTAENWRKLNELLGSADGSKFKVLAQGYTLDVLLGYANKRLKDISQRYVLERVSSDSLSLQVVDLDMLSEVRSVHSLSGGESFLISLALALGLSSLSSSRMSVESLFIDEGFGSLDADTLRVAMDALERLQTQGRKIGVISHVTEMTERIPVQIQVIKIINGKSSIKIR